MIVMYITGNMIGVQWIILWALWGTQAWTQPTEPVRIRSGLLRGIIAPDGSHAKYMGIPYATVRERFQVSDPEPTWDGVFNATNEHIRCIQRSFTGKVSGQEDCLILNVYTPVQQDNQLRPVMVFIHGGGYRTGSGSSILYGPDYLVKHNVILVTINYRLDILGFLCLGIKEAPGNVGLKDQVEALKWVRNNIRAFGGNPDDVTIFGESAGSASVNYHLLSPMSRGLFHKAMMQSATTTCPWSFQFEPLKIASLLAEQMGYQTNDPKELYQILSTQPAEKLVTTRVPRAKGDIYVSEYIFVPCVEVNEIPGVERFLPDDPHNLMITGQYSKVPILMGYNNAEGYLFASKENDTTIGEITFNSSLPRNLLIPTEAERNQTSETLRSLYMKNMKISKQSLWKFSKYIADSQFVYSVVSDADLLSKTMDNPVFAYKFEYDGIHNLAKLQAGYAKYPGATHGDELFYLFKVKPNLPETIKDRKMIDRMTTLWTNFAKYGDPTPNLTELLPLKWHPIDKMDPHILVIDLEFSTEPLWNDDDILYWNNTYTKYRRTG
ncbi:esterase FE4-like isoform X2 [Epargyreus clarus]|uniref:esterase FE4-like isoform X2 n=1 Tax=Epargyreus clarus TaxID=520877 RepID=UPI003C2B0191